MRRVAFVLLAAAGLLEPGCASLPPYIQQSAQQRLHCPEVIVRQQQDSFYLGWCRGDGQFEYGGEFPAKPVWLHGAGGACQPAQQYCAAKSSIQKSDAPAAAAHGRWSCTNTAGYHFVWKLVISGNEISGQSLAPGNNVMLSGTVLPSGLLEVNGNRVKVAAGGQALKGVGFDLQCFEFTCTR